MNSDDLRLLLAERATDIDTDLAHTVTAVHRRVHSARRLRAVGAGAAALALVAGTAVAVGVGGDDERSDGPATPPDTSAEGLDQFRTVTDGGPVDLRPGTWRVRATGAASTPMVVLDVPSGFTGNGNTLEAAGAGPRRAVSVWGPDHVLDDPCGSNDASGRARLKDVEGMAAALAALPRGRTTDPRPVTLGGYDGVTLRFTTAIDPRTCGDTVYYVFGTSMFDHWMSGPGETDRYWILDVEGDLLLLSTTVEPGASADQVAELESIVESARVVPTD